MAPRVNYYEIIEDIRYLIALLLGMSRSPQFDADPRALFLEKATLLSQAWLRAIRASYPHSTAPVVWTPEAIEELRASPAFQQAILRSLDQSLREDELIELNDINLRRRGRPLIDLEAIRSRRTRAHNVTLHTVTEPPPAVKEYPSECLICLEDGDLVVTNCGHFFHLPCLIHSLRYYDTCSNCNEFLMYYTTHDVHAIQRTPVCGHPQPCNC